MRRQLHTLAAVIVAFLTVASLQSAAAAGGPHDHSHTANSVQAEVVSPTDFTSGKTAETILRLTGKDGKPVTLDQLAVAHTEKLHLLIVDETLSDYHHEHPVPAEKPGEYRFGFTPRFGGAYHIWADVVPTATKQQEYAKTKIEVKGPAATRDPAVNTTAESGGYRFRFATENNEPVQVGKATLVRINVADADAKDFRDLEPVMGAFAHMVGFPADGASVMHVHPMGKEPTLATERGGPELSFHVVPEKAGFNKFFLQTQMGGKAVFVAFGQNVQPAAAKAAAPATASGYTCPMHPEIVSEKPESCPKCGMKLVEKT